MFVLSNEKDRHGRFIQKEAQCTIDTGNHHGNIVSREFLLKELKFPESAFMGKQLSKSEKEGISVTGHPLIPEGAINLDWYHAKSTQRYRGMRFLVSSNPRCDLIIGARSIEKHGILASPNLANVVDFDDSKTGMLKAYSTFTLQRNVAIKCTILTVPSDTLRQKHQAKVEELVNDLKSLKPKLKEANKENNPTKVQGLEAQKEEKERELEVARLVLELYVAKKKLQHDPTNQEKKDDVDKLGSKLDAAKKPRPNNNTTVGIAPQVTVTDLDGTTRTSTGLSFRTRRTRSRHS